MTPALIPVSRGLGYSDIYVDFVSGRGTAREFYAAGDLADTARRIDQHAYDRRRLAAVLRRQNDAFGVDEAARQNIEQLQDSRAVCVFAGQQAGLFGGPMFSIIKALAVAQAARRTARNWTGR